MPTYTYGSETGKQVTITSKEQAEGVILATAKVRQHNKEDLLKDKQLIDVAKTFGLNLNDVNVELSKDYRDYAYTHSFNKRIDREEMSIGY